MIVITLIGCYYVQPVLSLNPFDDPDVSFYSGSAQRSSCRRQADYNIQMGSPEEEAEQITATEDPKNDSKGKLRLDCQWSDSTWSKLNLLTQAISLKSIFFSFCDLLTNTLLTLSLKTIFYLFCDLLQLFPGATRGLINVL